MRRRPSLWTPTFALICAATLAFFTSLTMQAPVFPAYLRERARASDATIGLFIGLFSVVGVGLRPFVGRALARRSRRSFMVLGGGTTAVCSALYLASSSLAFLIPLRLAHGLSIASYYTATSTLVADTAPAERRGEALSIFSMFLYLGLAGGGALGLALEEGPGFGTMFWTSSAIGVACAAIAAAIDEPRVHAPESVQAERHPLLSRPALFPGAVLAFAAAGYASVLNFTADFAGSTGISGRTLFFPVLAGSVIVVRLFSGIASDRYGRLVVAGPGLGLFAAALALEAGAHTTSMLLSSAILGGIGFGLFFPSLMAFTIDRVRPVERGSAMGTFTGSFDLGFGLGSYALGAIKGAADYPTMYRAATGLVLCGFIVLAVGAARARAAPGDAAARVH